MRRMSGGHAPLYTVGNGCKSGGGEIVRALVGAGARVNAADGVQRCTALHMAARRGNLSVGRALVECGANSCTRPVGRYAAAPCAELQENRDGGSASQMGAKA